MNKTVLIKDYSVAGYERRIIHANWRLSESSSQSFWLPLRRSSDIYLQELGESGRLLVENLDRINGIQEVHIELYSFEIEVGKAFDLELIFRKVIELLKAVYKIDTLKVDRITAS